jgi:UDP-N-acetylmuramate dehydrogenase
MRDRLASRIGTDVLEDVPLREHTTLRIGGPARYFCEVTDAAQLAAALGAAQEVGIERLLLGGGSNLLVLDGGFDGLVVANRILGIEGDGGRVKVAAGESYHGLVERLADEGLAGLGFAAGVPGSVGGAVFGNAGCYGRAIGDLLDQVILVDANGAGRRAVAPEELALAYRTSALQTNGDVVEAITLRLDRGDPDTLRAEIADNLTVRETKHPIDLPSAGSYFKNLPPREEGERRIAAGLLLDQVGCKGLTVGGAAVFDRHANIIVNRGGASAEDVLALADEMKRRVLGRFGVRLEEEVRQVGIRGSEGR